MIKLNTYVFTSMLALSFLFIGCTQGSHKLTKKRYHTISKKVGLSAYKYEKYPNIPYYYLNGIYYYGGYYDNGIYHYGNHLYNQGYYYYDGYRYVHGQRTKAEKGTYGYGKKRGYHERVRSNYYKANENIKRKNIHRSLEYNRLKSIPVR